MAFVCYLVVAVAVLQQRMVMEDESLEVLPFGGHLSCELLIVVRIDHLKKYIVAG